MNGPPTPKFKKGDVLTCYKKEVYYYGVLFLVLDIDMDIRKNAQGNISAFSNSYSYLVKVVGDDKIDTQGEHNWADGSIVDRFWDLASKEAQILYGSTDS